MRFQFIYSCALQTRWQNIKTEREEEMQNYMKKHEYILYSQS